LAEDATSQEFQARTAAVVAGNTLKCGLFTGEELTWEALREAKQMAKRPDKRKVEDNMGLETGQGLRAGNEHGDSDHVFFCASWAGPRLPLCPSIHWGIEHLRTQHEQIKTSIQL